MLKIRIIPTLLVKTTGLFKGKKFLSDIIKKFFPNMQIIRVNVNEPTITNDPVIFAIFSSNPIPQSQNKCLISLNI